MTSTASILPTFRTNKYVYVSLYATQVPIIILIYKYKYNNNSYIIVLYIILFYIIVIYTYILYVSIYIVYILQHLGTKAFVTPMVQTHLHSELL